MRVLFISLATLLLLFVVLMTSRFWGLGQQYADFQHPFFDGAKPLIILRVSSEEAITTALKEKPDLAILLDVATTLDQKLIVFSRDYSEKEMSMEAFRGPKSIGYEFLKIKAIHPEVRELKDILTKFPQQRFVLNMVDNTENVHTWTLDALKDQNSEKRILLQSNYNVIMTSIREKAPFLLYGCSQADIMRFLTFESMWILPATPFKGDVYIAPFVLLRRPAFHESTLDEVRRRKKKIVLGPALDKKEYDEALRLSADGIIVENFADFLKWSRP